MTPASDQPAISTEASPNSASLAWVPWLQAGVTAMLVVLFLVIVGKSRQQSATIRQLQERVQGLENSRALDRTTGLEQQLRSTVERLQVVERNSTRIDGLKRETANLRQALSKLGPASSGDATAPKVNEPPLGVPPLPPLRPPAAAN
jgi:C4-dicarboxylate-specific signal transduction histidine kinase